MTQHESNDLSGWSYALIALPFALLFQLAFIDCMCIFGPPKIDAAMVADAIIFVRIIVGRIWQPQSRAWIFYLALEFLLIPLTMFVARLAGGH